MTFHFVDSRGIDWMVIPGLPADHPAGGTSPEEIMRGFTFRSGTGELRVLLRAEMRRTPALAIDVAPWRVGPRIRPTTGADWEALLDQAHPWP